MVRRYLLLLFLVSILCCAFTECLADTHYVCNSIATCNTNGGSGWSGTPSDSGTCGSKTNPCLTIKYGLTQFASGDTLLIGNGTYTGTSNMISDGFASYSLTAKNGSAGAYTTIKAETDWGVVIDGQGTNNTGWTTWAYGIVRGIHFKNSAGYGLRCAACNHVKVIRCAFEEQSDYGLYFNSDSSTVGSTNCLAEQNFAFGQGSYFFDDGSSQTTGLKNDRNIYRMNVVRRDFYHSPGNSNHYAAFASYYGALNAVYYQNNIAVDSVTGPTSGWYSNASLYPANGGNGFTVTGHISINEAGMAGLFEGGSSVNITDAVFYVVQDYSGNSNGIYGYNSSNTYNRIIVNGSSYTESGGSGFMEMTNANTITNSIFYGNLIGLRQCTGSNYNDLYNNTTSNYYSMTPGANDRTINPLTNGLLYPVRIENSSTLKTAGTSGGQIGPSILYRYGRTASLESECGGAIDGLSCQLYGETGWNELQDGQSGRSLVSLWPFPNEATIKTKMAAYSAHGVSGARGFATGTSIDGSAQTLTKYIWEYLGNQIPADVYGDTTAPTISGVSMSGCSLR